MTVSDKDRFEMTATLRRVLGEEATNTMMEYLPPSGWGDVARTHDIDRVSDRLTVRLDAVAADVARIDRTIKVLIGAVVTVASAILVMLVQLNVSISSL